MGYSFAVKQPNPTQNMKFLVTLAFLLAVASIVESAPQNSDGVTKAKCLESFDKFEFVNVYNCADECKIVICAKAQVCQFVNIVSRTNHVLIFAKKAKKNAVHYPKPQDYVVTTFQSINKSLYTLKKK